MLNKIKVALLLLLFPVLNWAYTGPEAEDAFFWHYAHQVFQQPSPVPPEDATIEGEGADFGVFFVNTNKWESFWAMGGIGYLVWGADWFTDKQTDPHYTPFSQTQASTTSARWILGLNSQKTFGLPWDFQAGTYFRWANGTYVTGSQMLEHPELQAYTNSPKVKVSLGYFVMSTVDTKNLVSNLQWIPGVGGLTQPAMGAFDLAMRMRTILLGPTAAWRTTDSASAFLPGIQFKQSLFDAAYSVKIVNGYRKNTKIIDYTDWANSLGNSKAYGWNLEAHSPIIYSFKDSPKGAGFKLNSGYWNSEQDGYGWKAGLSYYFVKELHMDLNLAYNDWSQDPIVGRTGGYKFSLSYYN